MNKKTLTIAWLYPDLMSIYGDRGNIITLQKRCEWRGISVTIEPITIDVKNQRLAASDLIFAGGAQDSQQTLVAEDLQKKKGEILQALIEKNIPGLYICGAYQFLGNYYKEADGTIISGLGIFDLHTENPGTHRKRLIGNVIAESSITYNLQPITSLVGFENHGGRTYLGKKVNPFATIIKGYGNNGEDKTEGAIYKNSIGSYFHGPILPKNPHIADWLISTALEIKYGKSISLEPLNDTLANQAHEAIKKRLL